LWPRPGRQVRISNSHCSSSPRGSLAINNNYRYNIMCIARRVSRPTILLLQIIIVSRIAFRLKLFILTLDRVTDRPFPPGHRRFATTSGKWAVMIRLCRGRRWHYIITHCVYRVTSKRVTHMKLTSKRAYIGNESESHFARTVNMRTAYSCRV